MKRIIAIFIAFVLMMNFCSCNKKEVQIDTEPLNSVSGNVLAKTSNTIHIELLSSFLVDNINLDKGSKVKVYCNNTDSVPVGAVVEVYFFDIVNNDNSIEIQAYEVDLRTTS